MKSIILYCVVLEEFLTLLDGDESHIKNDSLITQEKSPIC